MTTAAVQHRLPPRSRSCRHLPGSRITRGRIDISNVASACGAVQPDAGSVILGSLVVAAAQGIADSTSFQDRNPVLAPAGYLFAACGPPPAIL